MDARDIECWLIGLSETLPYLAVHPTDQAIKEASLIQADIHRVLRRLRSAQ